MPAAHCSCWGARRWCCRLRIIGSGFKEVVAEHLSEEGGCPFRRNGRSVWEPMCRNGRLCNPGQDREQVFSFQHFVIVLVEKDQGRFSFNGHEAVSRIET